MWTYNETVQVNELYHHGILGQKWGIRRYQKKDGSLTKAGEQRYGTNKGKVGFMKRADNQDRIEKKAAKLKKKRLSEEQRRAAQAKRDAIANEKKRQELMRSTDPNKILANQHLFTSQELNDIANRLQSQQRIASMNPKTISKGEKRINDIRRFADTMSAYGDAINNGQKAYNAFADVFDLPPIGKGKKETTKQKIDKINDKISLAEAEDKMKYLEAHGSLRGYEGFNAKPKDKLSSMKEYNDYYKTKKTYEKNLRELREEIDKEVSKNKETSNTVKIDTSKLGYSLEKLKKEEYINLDAIDRFNRKGYSTSRGKR